MNDSPKGIASGMLRIFEKKTRLDIFFHGVADGFLDIPKDLFSIAEDFFDTDNRWRNKTDKIRQMAMIKKGVTSDDFRRLLTVVIKKYISGVTEEKAKKLLLKFIGKQSGSMAFKVAALNYLIELFVSRIIPRFLVSTGLVGVVSIGAIQSRSVYASYDLRQLNSQLYFELRGAGDLDLLYFVVKDYVDPYIKAINYQEMNSPISNSIFEYYLSEVRSV